MGWAKDHCCSALLAAMLSILSAVTVIVGCASNARSHMWRSCSDQVYTLSRRLGGGATGPQLHALQSIIGGISHGHVGPSGAGLETWADSGKPIEAAHTPPATWYTEQSAAELERSTVFRRSWQLVGHISQLASARSFFSGRFAGMPFIVCRDEAGELRAFHNVCSHHAAAVATGSGTAESFTCPYHGWVYDLQGRLRKATRLKGIQGFRAAEMGLRPMHVHTWGAFVFLAHDPRDTTFAAWLGEGGAELLPRLPSAETYVHVGRREYMLQCNWKVFCDNYLDGGYHVPFAHPSLADGLDVQSYTSELCGDNMSVQRVAASEKASDRMTGNATGGSGTAPNADAVFVFVYPNLCINVYGPWVDTNLVMPLTANSCRVQFDWYITRDRANDQQFIEDSIDASHKVQLEDVELCESVQRGLASPAYNTGRYAPSVETPMHHFHRRLWQDFSVHAKA